MSGPHLSLHIERVVLRGVDAADRQAFVNGLRAELARVLGDPLLRAALTSSRRTPVLKLGKMPMEPGMAGTRKLGGGIARAIGKGIKA